MEQRARFELAWFTLEGWRITNYANVAYFKEQKLTKRFELLTSSLRVMCSTNWAISANGVKVTWTPNLLRARGLLSQLSYDPVLISKIFAGGGIEPPWSVKIWSLWETRDTTSRSRNIPKTIKAGRGIRTPDEFPRQITNLVHYHCGIPAYFHFILPTKIRKAPFWGSLSKFFILIEAPSYIHSPSLPFAAAVVIVFWVLVIDICNRPRWLLSQI